MTPGFRAAPNVQNEILSRFLEWGDADFGIRENGADFELAAQRPDVLRQGAYLNVGPALDPGGSRLSGALDRCRLP